MQEKENVIRILEEAKEAVSKEDVLKLKGLSNQTIHTASITHDPDNIAIAVIVYSLSKVIERGHHKNYRKILSSIDNSINAVKTGDEEKIKNSLSLVRESIELSGELKNYIQDVFRKARINKASKIYEHGISLEKTANLLGITMFELASYSGQKHGIHDSPENNTLNVKARIKLAMEMFS